MQAPRPRHRCIGSRYAKCFQISIKLGRNLCGDLHFGNTIRTEINRTAAPRVSYFVREGNMALKELELLTGELEKLAELFKAETRTQARLIILRRAHEIMALIGDCTETERDHAK